MERTIDPLTTMDAKLWADEFMATKARLGDKEFDHAMMLSWFANAIMVGYDEGQRRKAADAQAIIAALQSEVKDLKEWLAAYKQSLELAQSSLTQRTAERDTARRRVDELEAREVDVVLLRDDLEQRTAELEAANDKVQFLEKKNRNLLDSENLTLKVKADQAEHRYVRLASLQAELERVRGERDKLQSEVDGWELGSRVFP